jgi:hypothetical protein
MGKAESNPGTPGAGRRCWVDILALAFEPPPPMAVIEPISAGGNRSVVTKRMSVFLRLNVALRRLQSRRVQVNACPPPTLICDTESSRPCKVGQGFVRLPLLNVVRDILLKLDLQIPDMACISRPIGTPCIIPLVLCPNPLLGRPPAVSLLHTPPPRHRPPTPPLLEFRWYPTMYLVQMLGGNL